MNTPSPLDVGQARASFIGYLDMLTSSHAQARAILSVLQLSLSSKGGEPTTETIENAIWAVQDILVHAGAAVSSLIAPPGDEAHP